MELAWINVNPQAGVLNQAHFVLEGTLGNIWRHFWFSQLRGVTTDTQWVLIGSVSKPLVMSRMVSPLVYLSPLQKLRTPKCQ